jgi:hypothetical protein
VSVRRYLSRACKRTSPLWGATSAYAIDRRHQQYTSSPQPTSFRLQRVYSGIRAHYATQKSRHHRQVPQLGKKHLSTTPLTLSAGAGPSGLVTAKTLLHDFSQGTFAPVVFDTRHEVGGLWPNLAHSQAREAGPPGTLEPGMRTNLSRFTVAFSDLSWESVLGEDVPMFPQARQVGRYLAAYSERYVPTEALRLGHRVVNAVRSAESPDSRWRVSWVRERLVHVTVDLP